MFKAILVQKDDAGYRAGLTELDPARLPEGDVTVRVKYSTLNYKDALAITGKGPVVRTFPMVPGVDFAGIVESSAHAEIRISIKRSVIDTLGYRDNQVNGCSRMNEIPDAIMSTPEPLDQMQKLEAK